MPDSPARPTWGRRVDARSWVELAVGFPIVSAVFALLAVDLVRSVSDDPGFSARTMLVGAAIGTGVGLALALLVLWTWRRGPGRPAQRLGRRAWREGRLPATEPDRGLALSDLERRRRVLLTGLPPYVTGVLWLVIGSVQIVTSDSLLRRIAWVAIAGVLVEQSVRTVLDRRRLPQLDELLAEGRRDALDAER